MLPDPALVVLVGAAGSGKSTWAAEHYRSEEVVSSDALRGLVGSGRHDLGASDDAFAVLELIVAGRIRRGLTVVVDSLGTDRARRVGWLAAARRHGLAAVVVVLDTDPALCRRRNAARERPVPAAALAAQLARHREVVTHLPDEGWDVVHVVDGAEGMDPMSDVGGVRSPDRGPASAAGAGAPRRNSQGLKVVLQLGRFPWGEDPTTWLAGVARAADDAGLAGIALMDHLIQIPQVDRPWAPIPDPWVALGALAGLGVGRAGEGAGGGAGGGVGDGLELGTLVTPVTFRAAGITAKAAATLDVLTGGRAFVGVGAGWWAREHAAYGLEFPPPRERVDDLERAIGVMRALWAPGTRPHEQGGLPETTCYPRPVGRLPVIVGGTGPRLLEVAARTADAVNVPSALPRLDELVAGLRRHDPDGRVALTVLDLPTLGSDREDVWARVERLRGRSAAAAYAARTHAGTAAQHRDRWGALAERGVDTVFVALADLDSPEDVGRLTPLAV